MRQLFPCLALLLLATGICRSQDGTTHPLLARDDTSSYTLADLDAYLRLTNHPIREELLKRLLARDPAALDQAKKELSKLAFQRLYCRKDAGDLWDDAIRARLRRDLQNVARGKIAERLAEKSNPSDQEILNSYNTVKDAFRAPERRKISILYKVFPSDEQGREEVIRRLETLRRQPDLNERFLDVVKQNSDLPNALQGGVVDYFTTGTYGPTVEKHAFSAPAGELSPVFWASKGAYIVKVLDVKPAGSLSLDEVRSTLADTLRLRKAAALEARLIESAEKTHRVWRLNPLPNPIPGDAILLRIDDFAVTSATLPFYSSQFTAGERPSSETLRSVLDTLARNELLLRTLEDESRRDPDSPVARELQMEADLAAFPFLFSKGPASRIRVEESEKRDYYEKHREFYHGVTPKRLRYLLFKTPDRDAMSEPAYAKRWTALKREALAFLEQARKAPERFEELATAWAAKTPEIELRTSDWMEEPPDDWQPKIPLTEYTEKRISPLVLTPEGFLVFRVEETGKPRTLSYEEAEPKLARVVRSGKENILFSETLESTLKKHGFEFVYGEARP